MEISRVNRLRVVIRASIGAKFAFLVARCKRKRLSFSWRFFTAFEKKFSYIVNNPKNLKYSLVYDG